MGLPPGVPPRSSKLPPQSGKGPTGRPLCRGCKNEIPAGSRRRNWCSELCIEHALIRSSPGVARFSVHKRDRGICAFCKVDTDRVYRIAVILRTRARGWWSTDWQEGHNHELHQRRWTRCILWIQEHVMAGFLDINDHLWEADHILPVAEGGGSCGLENLRTLCRRCHGRESGALRRRLNSTKPGHQTILKGFSK